MKLRKFTGGIKHQRLIIRQFRSDDYAYSFLNAQYNNDWMEYVGDLKAGTYVFAGGAWRNVKSLDISVLAHC